MADTDRIKELEERIAALETQQSNIGTVPKPSSNLWYVLPIFLGLIGGFLGYVFVHDKDSGKARSLVAFSIICTFFLAFIIFVFFGAVLFPHPYVD